MKVEMDITKDQLPRIPPKHLKDGCYARADAIEAHLEAAKAENERLREELSTAYDWLGPPEHAGRALREYLERIKPLCTADEKPVAAPPVVGHVTAEPSDSYSAEGSGPAAGGADSESQQIEDDVRLYGTGFAMHLPGGIVKRLVPMDVSWRLPAEKSAESLPVKLYRDVSWNDAQGQSIAFECSLCGKSETPCKHWPTIEASSVPSAAGAVTTEASSAREASEPATVGTDQPWPTAWMRGVTSPGGPWDPPEHDAEFSYGDDKPEGDGWVPLYRAAVKSGEQP